MMHQIFKTKFSTNLELYSFFNIVLSRLIKFNKNDKIVEFLTNLFFPCIFNIANQI
jgi:hypothetical protein